eukprot:8108303-Prorocentrum_lima.AAC.1
MGRGAKAAMSASLHRFSMGFHSPTAPWKTYLARHKGIICCSAHTSQKVQGLLGFLLRPYRLSTLHVPTMSAG